MYFWGHVLGIFHPIKKLATKGPPCGSWGWDVSGFLRVPGSHGRCPGPREKHTNVTNVGKSWKMDEHSSSPSYSFLPVTYISLFHVDNPSYPFIIRPFIRHKGPPFHPMFFPRSFLKSQHLCTILFNWPQGTDISFALHKGPKFLLSHQAHVPETTNPNQPLTISWISLAQSGLVGGFNPSKKY